MCVCVWLLLFNFPPFRNTLQIYINAISNTNLLSAHNRSVYTFYKKKFTALIFLLQQHKNFINTNTSLKKPCFLYNKKRNWKTRSPIQTRQNKESCLRCWQKNPFFFPYYFLQNGPVSLLRRRARESKDVAFLLIVEFSHNPEIKEIDELQFAGQHDAP